MAFLCWIVTFIALIGAYYNSQGEKKGFYFWVVSNAVFAVVNASIGQCAQCFLFLAYLCITINGLVKWSK